ncbi:MAG: gluconokinase [Acidobacteriota bacterium]
MSNVLDDVLEGFEPSPELLSVIAGSTTPVLLALDIGTSGVRAALFDERGGEVAGQSIRIDSTATSLADFGSIDAEVLLEQVAEAIDALFANFYETNNRIEWIAVSCFWHSLVGVDDDGQATTPVFGWSDRRAAQATRQLRAEHDEATFHARTGCRFHPSYWPAKLLRLKIEEPEAFGSTSRWFSFAEYLTWHFFGETATSVSMASGSGLMDQRTCEWDLELLTALGISEDKLPEIASDYRTFKKLASAYAHRWPQLSEARMFPAIGDGAANNIGAGCSTREKVALMIGTSGAMRMLFEGLPPAQIPSELWCYRADRRRVVVGGALSDGGSLYRWIRESLLSHEDAESIEDQLDRLGEDAHGLTLFPFWSGERSTGWNPDARGAILGLTLQTRPIEILRAAMEAVAYRFALIAQALEPLAPGASVMVSGHALRSSPVWVQILADVLGHRLNVSARAEASTRGAALLALEAAGKIRSIEDFSVPVEAVFEPDMSRHARYRVGLERQQRIYGQVITDNPI